MQHDCHHLLGFLLDQSRRHARPRRPWRDHRADHDHVDDVDQRGPAEGLLRKIHRRLPGSLFLPRLYFAFG